MALLDVWKLTPEEIGDKHIRQLVQWAGDGKLRDGGDTGIELRQFLSEISTASIKRHVAECLESSFEDSGLVLQDLVNELGSRLNCKVGHGRYRGTSNTIGYDGIWHFKSGYSIVVEVKTTDAYTIHLDKIAEYRSALIEDGTITNNSSILIVVGRKDTGSLEAQVRGSKHAWDIRLISADKLVRLVEIKEDADSPETIDKIQTVLKPLELTRVDFIVDLLAVTTSDIQEGQEGAGGNEAGAEDEGVSEASEKKFTPVAFNKEVILRTAEKLGVEVKKDTRTLYASPDKRIAIRGLVSKTHEYPSFNGYWYAFHPHFFDVLEEYDESYVAFGCGSPEKVLLFTVQEFYDLKDKMNTTEREDKRYWHVHFKETRDGKIMQTLVKGNDPIDVSDRLI